MGPREGSNPHMGLRRASAVGGRARELQIAAGMGTHTTLGQQEHELGGDHMSRGRACGGGCAAPELVDCSAGVAGVAPTGTAAGAPCPLKLGGRNPLGNQPWAPHVAVY